MSSIGEATRQGEGYVYFIRASNGLIKIGHAKNPRVRLNQCKTDSPLPLEILFVIRSENRWGLESRLHEVFSARHSHGEWFALTAADLGRVRRDYGVSVWNKITAPRTNVKAVIVPGFAKAPRARRARPR